MVRLYTNEWTGNLSVLLFVAFFWVNWTVKHEHTTEVHGGMLSWENLKFRSSKTAANAPKTPIILILSVSAVHMAKIGSARTRSRQVPPY